MLAWQGKGNLCLRLMPTTREARRKELPATLAKLDRFEVFKVL